MAACASGRNESPLNISEIDFTPCLDEKQHETFRGRLAPVDMDAFIDEEFGKIYEGEEMYSDTAPKYDSNQWPTETQSGLLEQIQCLDRTGALLSGPDGVFEMSGCGLGEEKRLEESRSHEAHVCCPCKFKKSTCSMETVERAGNPSETITLDNDKGCLASEMAGPNPENSVVTEEQLADISEDVGTCFKKLGPKLGIKASVIHNIDEDYKRNIDKANTMLLKWKHGKGSDAKVKHLMKALCDIDRKDIADKLLQVGGFCGIVTPCTSEPEASSFELKIKFQLTMNSQTGSKVLLCEDGVGRKYFVKELKEVDWNVEEILQNETKLARALSAVEKGPKNNKEQKRQESLKRISAELHDLRERLKKNRIDSADSDDESMPSKCEEGKAQDEDQKQQKHKQELEDMLKSCEFQCQCWQGMFNGIIKLLGEVGVLEDNSKCVRQLCDFTKELRQQEHRFFPRIEQLDKQQEQLNEMQIERLASLQKWQRAQNQQVEGIEKLLTSLLDPGNMKMRKVMNRRSEPALSLWPKWTSGAHGRRRSKTDSAGSKLNGASSLNDVREVDMKSRNISGPLCARRMCMMDMDSTH